MGEKDNNINELASNSSPGQLVISPEHVAVVVVDDGPGALEIPAPAPRVDVLDVFLSRYENPKSRQTMLDSLDRIERVTHVPRKRLAWAQLTEPAVAKIHALLGAEYSRATVELTMTTLRQVLKTHRGLGLMTREAYLDACEHGRWQGRILEPPGRSLSVVEVGRIAQLASARGPYGAFLGGFFAMALGAGLRATELCELPGKGAYQKLPDGTGEVLVVGKGNKEARQPLGPGEVAALERWLGVRSALEVQAPVLFPRIRASGALKDAVMDERAVHHLCAEVAKAAGLAPFMPHDLRRTFATRLYEMGYSDSSVQKMMRHASANTTRRYDRRSVEKLRELRMQVQMWPGIQPGEKT
jgi:integrase/recombinase XerD